MYYVYLLKMVNGKIYAGSTPDLKRRIREHQSGKCLATKNFGPINLVWYGSFMDRLTVCRFEKYLKTGSGFAFRNKRLLKSLRNFR